MKDVSYAKHVRLCAQQARLISVQKHRKAMTLPFGIIHARCVETVHTTAQQVRFLLARFAHKRHHNLKNLAP